MTAAPRWLVWTHDRELDGEPAYLVFEPTVYERLRVRRRRTIAAGFAACLALSIATAIVAGMAIASTVAVIASAAIVVLSLDSTYGRATVRTTWNPLLADLDLARRRAPYLLPELHPLVWGVLTDGCPRTRGGAPVHPEPGRRAALASARHRVHAEVESQGTSNLDRLMRAH